MKKPRFKVVSGAGNGAGERAKRSLPRFMCSGCQTPVAPKVRWAGMHLQGSCPNCGRWLRWLTQEQPWLDLAEPEETQETDDTQPSMFEDVA